MADREVEAETTEVWAKHDVKHMVPLDRFCVRYGYGTRDSIQIRLQEDGREVYLSDDSGSRPFGEDRLISATVPFEVFADAWPRFIEHVGAKAFEEGTCNG